MRDPHLNGGRDTSITRRDAGTVPNDASRVMYDEFKRMYEAEQVLSLKDLIQMLRRRLWVIMLTALLLAGLAAGYSWSKTPTYEASAMVLVMSEPESDATADLQNQVLGLQALMPTITQMAMSYPVAQDIVQRLDLSASPASVLGGLSVEKDTDTQFLYVSYYDSNPERARLIANSGADVISERISEVNPGANAVEAKVWERAKLPSAPVSPNPVRNTVLMLIVGLMLGAGLAFLLEYLDDGWRSPDEAEQVLGVPTLGIVPSFKAQRKNKRKPFWR